MTSSLASKNPEEILGRAFAFALSQHQQGNLKQAEQTYRQILQAAPNQNDAMFHLSMLLAQTGRRYEAIQQYRTLLKRDPGHADAWNNLGNLLQATGKAEEAGSAFDQARTLRPSQPEFHYNYGNLLISCQGYDKAEEAYRAAIALKPDYLEAWNNLGLALQEQGRLEEAESIFRDILKRNEQLPQTWNNLGVVLSFGGRIQEAEAAFQCALRYDQKLAAAWRQSAHCKRFVSSTGNEAQSIRNLLNAPDLPEADAMHLHYALGKIHDDCNEYDQAFRHFQQANSLQKRTVSFHPAELLDYVDRITAVFTSEFFTQRKGWGAAEAEPLFIIGMPRTGKTLIERILTKHQSVHGGGEKILIRRVVEAISLKGGKNCYPEATTMLQSDGVKTFASAYIEQQWQKGRISARYISDTLPYNFLHLGLIALLFPKARILHCRRDPMDTILLNYCHYFTRGSGHACDLEDLTAYYKNYRRLMAHWQQMLPLPICTIEYETLVSQPEKETARVLAFLELDDRGACLEESRALYEGEAGKWRHYAKYLESAQRQLAGVE